MKRYFFILVFIILSLIQPLKADDIKIITDIYTGNKISYTNKYSEVKNNHFNLFDEINIQYPQLVINPKANEKLFYYCVKYIESDSFKLELLQSAKIAASIFLQRNENRYNYSQYVYNNYEKFLPVINKVDCGFIFLFNNLLALHIEYEYKIENHSESFSENFTMEKTIYISLDDAKVFSLEQLIDPGKLQALKSNLQKKATGIYLKNKKTIDGETNKDNKHHRKGEPYYYGESGQTKDIKDSIFHLNELQFMLTPFSTSFIISAFSVNSVICNGAMLQINYSTEEIRSFINAKTPLHALTNYNKSFTTGLKNCNIYKEIRFSDWRTAYNIQNDNYYYVTAPAKGIKSITYNTINKDQPDSSAKKQKRREFDSTGKLVREVYFANGDENVSSTQEYEYNKQNLLYKITRYAKGGKPNMSTFLYDANSNLIKTEETSSDSSIKTTRYFYDGNTVYELTENELYYEGIREYHINDYGKITSNCQFLETCDGEIFYDKNKLVASFSKKRPNLDNAIYCYDAVGKLLTCQNDNGRHLYELTYNAGGKLKSVIHMDSRQVKDIWKYEYDKNGLLVNFTAKTNIYDYDSFSSLFRYKLDYEFY